MTVSPTIFISAVSKELRSARQLVANTLKFLAYEPDWQEIFGTEEGDLRGMLRRKVDASAAVVQIVGQCYGAEPKTPDEQFGRVSYTQYEALYAKQRGKKVWYLLLGEGFTADPHEPEPDDLRALQAGYRQRVEQGEQLYYLLGSSDALEATVLKLRKELKELRQRWRQWAIGVAALLIVSVGLGVWLLQREQATSRQVTESNKQLTALNEKLDQLLKQGVMKYATVETRVREQQPNQKPGEIESRTYTELGKELGVDPQALRNHLPAAAEKIQNKVDATNYERANAAYVRRDFQQAEQLAMLAAQDAQKETTSPSSDAMNAFVLAGNAAHDRGDLAGALQHFRTAEAIAVRLGDPSQQADVERSIAFVLDAQRKYSQAEQGYRDVVRTQQRLLGPKDPGTFNTRQLLGLVLWRQGKYAEAKKELQDLVQLQQEVLGPEHRDTLSTCESLLYVSAIWSPGGSAAQTLKLSKADYATAEAEYRDLIKLEKKVLGPEDPDTLRTRGARALLLSLNGNDADAIAEYREIIEIQKRVLGPEDPATLSNRDSLALDLDATSPSDAEKEFREIIASQEKTLGAEDPDVLTTRSHLILVLLDEGKYSEAEQECHELIQFQQKLLGPEQPDTLETRSSLARALVGQEKYPDAEAEYRQVIAIQKKVLGPQAGETLSSRAGLATTLSYQGKSVEAEAEFRQVIPVLQKILGPENPDILEDRAEFAKVLLSQGKNKQAETELRAVIKLQEKALGEGNHQTLKTVSTLADVLRTEHNYSAAETAYRRVITGEEQLHGPDRYTILHRDQLASVLMDRGKLHEAEKEYRELIPLEEKLLGPGDQDTAMSCYSFALCLQAENRVDEAREFAQRAVGHVPADFQDAVEKLVAELQSASN